MLYLLLVVIVGCSGVLLYLAYRDQKQEKNSYRTNTFHICRIEVLEERDFLSASPFDDPYDDNDDYEPPYNSSDTYIEYNAYSNAVAQQAAPQSAAIPAAMPDPIYAHNLLNDGTSLVTSAGNYY
ncbi:MAG: hypothetical protein LBH00_06365, partial [Planctomycetaceae bacterium]|nr:hypothetical protein [Planctomycetaceae bacterium]